MASGLSLTLPASFGNQTLEVEGKRFSIGRTPENDLEFDDPSLSRRHAVIEDVEGRFMLSDCGSSNGTFVNGRQILAPTELADWDVLTFGGIGDVLVRIQQRSDPVEQKLIDSPTAQAIPSQVVAKGAEASRAAQAPAGYDLLSRPVLAIAATVVILLLTGVALMISQRNSRGPSYALPNRQQRAPIDKHESTRTPAAADVSDTVEQRGTTEESSELSVIESYASKVLMGISRDTRPVLTEKPLEQINVSVQRYKGSASLQAQLQTMKRSLPQVSAIAKNNGLRTPLAVYATLARIDRDGRGDPVQVAADLCPTLQRMRGIFGDELAADSLLAVAGLEEGPSLQWKINRLAGRVNDSPSTIRSVWYLHDHQVISDQTYNFVLRFLAIGVIAQDPQKFGISAEPLIF